MYDCAGFALLRSRVLHADWAVLRADFRGNRPSQSNNQICVTLGFRPNVDTLRPPQVPRHDPRTGGQPAGLPSPGQPPGHRLDLTLRHLYGPRFERANPGRLLPVVDRVKGNLVPAAFSASPVETPDPSQRRPLRGHSRKALPADLCAARRLTLLSACARRSDDTEAF